MPSAGGLGALGKRRTAETTKGHLIHPSPTSGRAPTDHLGRVKPILSTISFHQKERHENLLFQLLLGRKPCI